MCLTLFSSSVRVGGSSWVQTTIKVLFFFPLLIWDSYCSRSAFAVSQLDPWAWSFLLLGFGPRELWHIWNMGCGAWGRIHAPVKWETFLTLGLGHCLRLSFCPPRRRTCSSSPLHRAEGGWSRWKMQATCSLSSLLHSPHICKTTFVLNWIEF